jgi:hypothetical protein
MAEGCDEAHRDRIASDVEDNRNCLRGRFGGKCRSGGIRYGDYGDPTPNQIGDHFRKPVIVPPTQRYSIATASQLLWRSPTSRARASSATAPRLPDADRRTHDNTHCRRSDPRYPRFRRDLFARDVALDPGGTTMPRITALRMLRSTMRTVSAPASSSFRGSLPHPTHPLCTLRVRRHRRLTQHSLPGGSLGLTWAGIAPADRASFAWRLPLLDHRGERMRFSGPGLTKCEPADTSRLSPSSQV